ncbi:peptidase inhibitor family I36 protein [Streptomyces sp. NPDC059578]|uniref:peptidase inhibitor family I36 protein n=1 Tax=Streptomyces sp. NPDC059578 TaxID=3346874 RepID=UPI0036AD015C
MRSTLLRSTTLAVATAAVLLGPAHAGTTSVPTARPANPPDRMATQQQAVPSTQPRSTATTTATTLGRCGPGELCLWAKTDFKGTRLTYELSEIDIESCVALPAGGRAQALANRLGRPVTTYQSAECEETGEFDTYPGNGTWTPQSPHRIRAFKVWEN